ncbi:DUF4347 domain-containing protein [Vreelandella salicampi]|uniref:DUF4347 domain-containing protein n=1 Tax=Vreelandella salicampi TaxID=1449798 RepID=A0A7Z0LP02_9GAMM|nr:DUF4347 domain-containing protein [Halomonas salicampi]NYS62413.1 DUF4347 domain-containing protein [Halomonas salicampi]
MQHGNFKEVIFIDTGVDDWQSLVDGVPQGNEIVILDSTRDGLVQMAEWAAGREGYGAIHILSHGSQGEVQLGTASLNNDTLPGYSEALAKIGQSLTEDGDILLYGCNVAADQTGLDFIGKLSQITGADIAASSDLTGANDKGGNWVLEQQVGEIKTQSLLGMEYDNVLAAPVDQAFSGMLPYMHYYMPYTVGGSEGLSFSASPGSMMAEIRIIDEPTGFTTGNAAYLFVDMGNYVEFSSVDPDGDGPDAKSLFTLNQLAAGYYQFSYSSSYEVSGWAKGSEVVSVEVDLASTGTYGPDAASAITYTKSDQDSGMYAGGALNFGSAWTNIDTVRFTVSDSGMMMGMVELLLDTIDFSDPVQEDTTPPTVTIDVADTSLIADETSEVTFTFNEAVQGFSNANLTVANGMLSAVETADGGKTWTATLTPISNINDDTNVIAVVLDGVSDLAGNVGSGTTNSNNYAINTTVPDAPALALEGDSGVSDNDGVTNNGQVNVSGLVDGATWEYSTDDGETWSTGNGTSFTLQEDGAKSVIVRQSDASGNKSAASAPISVNVDTSAPTWSSSTPADEATDVNGADNITLTFDEAVLQGTGNVTLYNVTDSATVATIAANDAQISGWGTTTITIDPSVVLPGGTNVAVQWDGTIFHDTAGNNVASVSDTTTFNFQTANSAPVVDLDGSAGGNNGSGDDIANQSFTENGSAVAVAPDVTVSDAEGDTLSATVNITNAATGDSLSLSGTYGTISDANVTGSGAASITISGSHSAADIQAALRAITFSNTSDDPGDTARTVNFTVNDGHSVSAVRTSTIAVNTINDAPALTTPGTITLADTVSDDTFSDQTGQLSGSDPDSGDLTYGFNGAGASAALTEGGITYDLSVEGTYGTLYLEKATGQYLFRADAAAVNALNADASEDFTVSVSDGIAPAVTKTLTVDLAGANDAPTLDLNGSIGGTSNTATFASGGDPVEVTTADATLNDVDSGDQIESLTATLTTRPDGDGVESLLLNSTAGTAASDNALTVNYTEDTGMLSVTGAASASTYQTILRGIQYDNTDAAIDITISDRTVNVVVNDGTDDSLVASATVGVVTAPVVGLSATGGYREGDGGKLIATGATITEPDGDNLNQLVITLTNPQDGASESLQLSGRGHNDVVNGITVNYDSSTQITLTGTATAADYQTLLRELQYENASKAPSVTNRSISVQGTDVNGNPGATATLSLPVEPVNDAPTGTVTISGIAEEDKTLTASNDLADGDGLGSIGYQWLRDGSAIIGATGESYTLTQADVGAEISVRASYTDQQGTNESVTSAATATVANINDAPTGNVTITGASTQGETLNADTSGLADEDGLGSFSYQWLCNGVDISGATGITYTLTQSDVDAEISVRASYTDVQGTAEAVISSATVPVANVNDAPTGSVIITGTAEQNVTLTASNDLADIDGMGTISYQWLRDGVEVTGATGENYTLTQSDVDAEISVRASYTDVQGTVEAVTSSATVPVANVNDAPTGSVIITGTAEQSVTLTASNNLADIDGMGTVSYQWLRDGVEVTGATGENYTLTQSDVDAEISVRASYTDVQGTAEAVISSATVPVENVNDAPTGSVIITGTARQGETLTVSNTLADEDGLGTINYQWLRDDEAIEGATKETYTLGRADIRAEISVQARYTDGQGTAETVASLVTDPVIALPVSPSRPEPELEVDVMPLPDTPMGESAIRETFKNTSNETRSARLVENTGNNNVVTATLPGGMQLSSDGSRTATERDQALANLVASIEDKEPSNVSEQTQTAVNWLNTRPDGTQLDIRTLTFTSDIAANDPIVIRGETDNSTSGFQEAFVIDVTNLPGGTRLQLDNIDFASIKGAVSIEGGEGDNVVIGDNEAQVILLGPGDDELWGGGGDDTIGSMGGNDRLFGEQGNDLIYSDSGANVFHGGLDEDTVRYEGNRDEYVVSQQHAVITVYRHDKPEDADTLINIEQLVFADDQLTLGYDSILEEVTALYAQVLGRQGDVEGVQYWAQRQAEGLSKADMAQLFITSPEAGLRLDVQGDGIDTVLGTLYGSLLGREADAPGKAYWASELESGASLRDVVGGFMDSEEIRTHGMNATQWDFIA